MNRRAVFWSIAAFAIAGAWLHAWLAGAWFHAESSGSAGGDANAVRCAQQFVAGGGSFVGPGTEGGPDSFGWAMWLVLPAALGFDGAGLAAWNIVAAASCHAAVTALLAVLAWRASGGHARVPVAACVFAASGLAARAAGSGGEAAWFALLVLAVAGQACRLRCARAAWRLGFFALLAAMTRPEGAFVSLVAAAFVAFDAARRRAPALLLGYASPFALVFVPFLFWHHAHHGVWLPPGSPAAAGTEQVAWLGLLPIAWWALQRPDLLAAVSPFLGRRPWLVLAGFVAALAPTKGCAASTAVLLLAFDFACLRWRAAWFGPAMAIVLVVANLFVH